MLRLLEVFGIFDTGSSSECISRQDVTENTEAERSLILQATREFYGLGCAYRWQNCGHDEGRPCSVEEIP